MTSIVDVADDAVWWAIHRWRVVVLALVAVAAVVSVVVVLAGRDDRRSVPSGAVATIGSTPISAAAVDHWQSVFQRTSGRQVLDAADARRAAFRMLTQAGWIDAEAARLKATVSRAQLDASEQQLLASSKASKAQVLAQLGLTESDLRTTQRTALLTSALQRRVVERVPAASDAQARAQYAAEPELWAHPSVRDARLLVTSSAGRARQAIAALRGGTPFATVAQRFSSDSQLASSGGVVTGVKPGATGEPALEHALFSARAGRLQGPVRTSSGWAVFTVRRIVGAPARTLASAAPAIKTDLRSVRQAQAIRDYVTEVQRRWKARTTCRASVADASVCGARA